MAKKEMTREDRVSKICSQINKGDFGGEDNNAVMFLGSRERIPMERFPSGDQSLDRALGGGWPKGRFSEIYGPESGGKSTLCLHAIAEFQKKFPDDDIALIDAEYSFDEEYAVALGVNTRYLIVHQPDNGQQALNVLKQLIQLGIGLIIVDSVAALTTKAEVEGDLGDDQVAQQARLMSSSLRLLTGEAGKRGCTVLWTNQLREKIGVSYGDKTTTPAGRALKHYASIRCSVRRIGTEKETVDGEKIAIANRTRVDVKKNKTFPPYRTAEFFIVYGRGIDPVISLFDEALRLKVISKRGAWFSYGEENIGQGRYNTIEFLREDNGVLDKIKEDVEKAKVEKVPVTEYEKHEFKKPSSSRSDEDDEVEVQDV